MQKREKIIGAGFIKMDTNEGNRLQYEFLKNLAENDAKVIIFLTNGIKLRGMIVNFDLYSISMKLNDTYQLIYKNAISTISPWYEKVHGPWETNSKENSFKKQQLVNFKR